jgi:beta-lactamase regulating signal transducer with metallopeptidase domain
MGAYLTVVVLYLGAASWQIAVLTAAVAATTFALRRRSAHVRHLLWLIVVAKCLVPPLYAVPLPVLPPAEHQGPLSVLPPPWHPDGAIVVHPVPPDTLHPLQNALPFRAASEPGARQPAGGAVGPAPLGWIAGILWLIGAGGYLMMNLLRALRGHAWLWKTRRPLPEEARAEAADLLRTYGARRLPRIWLTEGVGQPFVWGLVRGSIYVPPSLLSLESPAHRRDVLAHELSHVLRCDAAVNVLQVVAQGLFWFHPLVWWTNYKIRQEREKCCDEMVIARLHTTPKDYSTAIVEALAHAGESARPVPSLAVASPLKHIEERMRTMLWPGRRFSQRPGVLGATLVLLAALLTVPTTLVLTARAGTDKAKEADARDMERDDALPAEWRLSYDDGLRAGGGWTWPAAMARDLARLQVIPAGTPDASWTEERYEFEVRSPEDENLGTMEIRFDRPEFQMRAMTLKPGRYLLRYTRRWGKPGNNLRIYSGPFAVDLPEPGMYELRFPPRLGDAEITGSAGGCYAVNFEKIDGGLPVTGFVYQGPARPYAVNGLPGGTYRLSAVTQRDGGNVFVRQAQTTVRAGERRTVDITPPAQGNCSLQGTLLGKRGTYRIPGPEPAESKPRWFVLIRRQGSGPVRQTDAYEALTMDSYYVVRGAGIVQETQDRARYAINGIAPGTYTVTALEHPWFGDLPIERQQSKPLTIRDGEKTALDFDLGSPTAAPGAPGR